MHTQTKFKQRLRRLSTRAKAGFILVVAVVFAATSLSIPRLAEADTYEQQIQSLQTKNNQVQAQINELRSQATSYEAAIQLFETQINSLAQQIAANEAAQAEVQRQINEAQLELDRQKAVLGENIRTMYLEGKITTVEMLATSKNLSDFVDKEAYRGAVQRQIQETLAKIAELQNQLNTKKIEIETLIKEQQQQRATLDAARAEQASLLSMNRDQQNAFSQQVKSNNAEIARLKQKQAEENCRIFGCGGGILGGGGYPWGSAKCLHNGSVEGSCPNYDWSVNGNAYNYIINYSQGYGFRNCTDWVAFRSGGRIPSAWTIRVQSGVDGNAKWWDDAGRNMGKRVSSSPQRGDAAVSNGGDYGHVMYVEDVLSDGSIVISDYNRAGTGKYSTDTFTRVGDGIYRYPTGAQRALTFVTF